MFFLLSDKHILLIKLGILYSPSDFLLSVIKYILKYFSFDSKFINKAITRSTPPYLIERE
jgi:hypothetical protein